MMPLSVVICTYNRSNLLEKCLNSLSKQSFKNFEVVVVDGDSNDRTPIVLKNYQKFLNLRVFKFPEKELAKARDLGWRKAKGEIVSWIDDDVVVDKNWAKNLLKIFKNPNIAGVTGPTIVPSKLIRNRDIFWFYQRRGLWKILSQFWNWFFLERKMYEPGKLLKSGAWTPGSNFKECFRIKGIKEVDYLEACNMSIRKNLIPKAGGFDFDFKGTAEWSELDLAIKIKKMGYKLVFSPKVKVLHQVSKGGVFTNRTLAKSRMENFLKFYFRHIFRPKPNYIFKFFFYLLFLNVYWIYKTFSTKNIGWLGGLSGTFSGLKKYAFKK